MALKYIDNIGTKPKDTIEFINVHEIGSTILGSPITPTNNYNINSNDVITSKNENIINAIDIDWNGATFKTLGKYTSSNPYGTINSTADLLRNVGNGIDEAYGQGTNALNRANDAYDLAQQALDAGNIDAETIAQIQQILNNGVVTSLTNNTNNRITGDIKLTSSISETDLPILIYQGTGQFSFGISKNTLLSYLKTTDLGNGIEYIDGRGIVIDDDHTISVNTDDIATRDYVNSQIINYSEGEGINIDSTNNQISVDTDAIATIEYVNNKGINNIVGNKGINVTDPNGDHNFKVSMVLNDNQNTGHFKIDSTTGELNLSDYIINKINSSGSGITITDVSNYLTAQHYVTKDGDTKGPLAVINGTQVNASNATTNGTDIFISSDKKLKDNILDIRQDEVDKLFATESGNMHYFEWRENHKPSFGFIAQELIDFAPETVTKDSEYMQVNYNAALTKTCAALFKKIKELENRIQELENK